MNVEKLISENLIGKKVRVCTYFKPFYQDTLVRVKKSANVTDKQFAENPDKFGYFANKKIYTGKHAKYENLEIKRIEIYGDNECDTFIDLFFTNPSDPDLEIRQQYDIQFDIPLID